MLDTVIVPDDLTIYDSGTIANPANISDHSATYLTVPHNYSVSCAYSRRIWLYKIADFAQLDDLLRLFNWECLRQGSVNDYCELCTNKFMEFVNSAIPYKDVTIRPSDKPWYDTEIRKYSRKRAYLKSKAIKSSSLSDWNKYKTIRNTVNNLKTHAKETFYNNIELSLLTSFSNNKKEFWKSVRHFVNKKDSVSTMPHLRSLSDSGEVIFHISDEEKANCLNSYFASVSSVDDSHATLPPFTDLTDKVLSNIIITEQEIKDIIDPLDTNKASGPNLISNKTIKNVSGAIAMALCIIFNRSMSEGIFPDIWKLSNFVPLFKKGEKAMPSNYRPVALLSNFGKVLERIIFKHIYNHL